MAIKTGFFNKLLEHKTLRVNQIVTRILLCQAIDASPRFCQTSNRCNAGEVTVWKLLVDIECRVLPEARGERARFWVQHDISFSESVLPACWTLSRRGSVVLWTVRLRWCRTRHPPANRSMFQTGLYCLGQDEIIGL
jgi:hypothetical protein